MDHLVYGRDLQIMLKLLLIMHEENTKEINI